MKEIRPVIYTRQLKETVAFYTEKLGFTGPELVEEDIALAFLGRNDIEIMVTLPNTHIPFEKPVFTGSFYITTEDVDALWAELHDKAEVCYPLETFDYGMREFAIYDNNGYLLQFGQEVS